MLAVALLPTLVVALASLPDALNVTFPFAYMQSSFTAGHNGIDCRGHSVDAIADRAERLRRLRIYASSNTSFRGGEMFINTMETPTALMNIREMNTLILQVANETCTPPFYGFWIPSRLPGMWWQANYTAQPLSYRAKGLMSNGSEWVLYPTQFNPTGTSILNLQGGAGDTCLSSYETLTCGWVGAGTDLDITNSDVVDQAVRTKPMAMLLGATHGQPPLH
jgi:hypothetical protein